MPREQTPTRIAGIVARHPMAAAVVVSALVALALVSPFLIGGTALGHDAGFHLDAWVDASHSWRAGVLYPRWAALANGKYGEPRFIFYPPLSWMLGAALSLVLPWKMVPGAFVFLALTLAGVSMFRLAREWLPDVADADALLAGALYAANPYHMLVIYQRSAYAELLAGALFPLVLLYALRLANERWRWRAVPPLAMICGAIWLTNAPAGVMSSYALLLLLLVMAWRERSRAPVALGVLVQGGAALALGLMLAAVYIVPAAVEQPWVRINEALSLGFRPEDNFLFASTSDALHDAFNRMVSVVALVEIAVFALAAWSSRKREGSEFVSKAWWPVATLGVVASLLMLRISAPLWRIVPKAQFMQFPWRWLVILSACIALLVAAAIAPRRNKPLAWVVTGLLLVLAAQFVVERSWQVPSGAELMVDEAFAVGYEGSDEYAPVATDHDALQPELPAASVLSADGNLSDAHAEVVVWDPETRRVTIVTEKPEQVVLRLVSYPAWQVEVNGRVVATTVRPGTGEIVVPVPAGRSDVRVRFTRTKDRTVGGVVSFMGLFLLLLAGGVARIHTGEVSQRSQLAGSRQ